MAKMMKDTGKYSVKGTNEVITYDYEFKVYEASDGCENLVILELANRQEKVDANNQTRAKIKTENGHSDRQPLTAEEKIANKAKRQADKELLNAIKSKGLSLDDILNS